MHAEGREALELTSMKRAVRLVHSVIKFSSESAPAGMRNSRWYTSRFDIVPQD